ncbi:MAG: gliding motility-associated C-terminal domain-containing protein, partial [Bacteroidota bacterium]
QISNTGEAIDTRNQPSKSDVGLPVAEQKKSPIGIGTDVITQTPKGEVADNQYLTKEIPNIFTPNGDGLNDYFEIPLADGMKHQTKIFDKSGALIAEFDERLEGWNGTGRGAANVSDGTYFYVTFVSDGKSTPKQYKGSIILKR